MSDEEIPDDWAAAMGEQADAEEAGDVPTQAGGIASAELDELVDETPVASTGDVKMDAILDVPVTVSMEIGRTNLNIRNLLQLNQGSVVELDRLAGEPMDVLVNGTLIAKGEVVVVNEKFGIRLTDIVSPADRVKRLSE
ncbi:MAG: flagellar motor switch protein FliN [Gammaproteobacteria bacterium]|nr:flagellar motor switch protein FliN [Gammaproteobacteria bacterium]NNJ92746.1 flagellar motor switch protein FliN [Gammaproteobacteria bacterium]